MSTSTMGPPDDAVSGASPLERIRTRVMAAATPAAISLALALYLAPVAGLSIADLPLGRRAPGVPRWWLALAVAPVAFMVLYLLENAAFGVMLRQYPAVSPGLVTATSPVTTVTLLAYVVALPTLILSLLVLIVGALRRRGGAAGVA